MISFTRYLIALTILNTVQGALWVIFPISTDSCTVSQSCQIKWKDDSNAPSTTKMGETKIDLVMGDASNLQAIQNIGGVSDPSVATAFTFTPNATLSSTQQYAVRFVAANNPSHPIFSTFFKITGGSGTAKAIVTPNSLAVSNSGSGSQAPTGTSSNSTSTSQNSTAAAHAEKSPASLLGPSLTAIITLGVFSGCRMLF